FDWIRKILGKPLAHGYRSVTGFFSDHWSLGFGRTAAAVRDVEISTADPFTMTRVVEDIPGNRVNATRQFRCVDIEEAHCARAVCVSREQRCDIGAELVVCGMPDHLPVNYHRDRRTIN